MDATTSTRTQRLIDRLRAGLAAEQVEVEDESALHAGHAGASGGAGHYAAVVVSARFAGLDPIARHRAVYAAVGDMMPGEIHALALRTYTPEEWHREAQGR